MRETRPFVLSVAGLDPSAGAGLLTDIKTLEQSKVSGLGVATCLTMQNHESISKAHWFEFSLVQDQIDALFKLYAIGVAKIGVVPNWNYLDQIVDYLRHLNPSIKIIVDPIFISSSGFEFCKVPNDNLRDKVLKKIFLLTPNQIEFDVLFGNDENVSCNVLLKSVKETPVGTDALIDSNGKITYFESEIIGFDKHGSGCILSSAIAANLAKGESLISCIVNSKRYIEKYLIQTKSLMAHHS